MKKRENYDNLEASRSSVTGMLALQGINYNNGNKIDPLKKRLEDYEKARKKMSNKEFDKVEEELDEAFELKEEEGPKVTPIKKKDRNREIKCRGLKGLIYGLVIVTGLGTAYLITEIIKKHNRYMDTIKPYQEEIVKIVGENSTKRTIRTKLYAADEYEVKKTYYDYDYDGIAKAIEKSDNPDMLVYALYSKYGDEDNYQYRGLTDRVCKHLTYVDSNGYRKTGGFLDYASQWSGETNETTIKENYVHGCKKELVQDEDDDILDNLRIKVLKRK